MEDLYIAIAIFTGAVLLFIVSFVLLIIIGNIVVYIYGLITEGRHCFIKWF